MYHCKLQCVWSLIPQKDCNLQCFEHVKHEYPDYFFFDPELPGGPRGKPRGAQGGPGSPGFQGGPVSPINKDQKKKVICWHRSVFFNTNAGHLCQVFFFDPSIDHGFPDYFFFDP